MSDSLQSIMVFVGLMLVLCVTPYCYHNYKCTIKKRINNIKIFNQYKHRSDKK